MTNPLRLAAPVPGRFEFARSFNATHSRDPGLPSAAAVVQRVRAEFGEMQGFSPTAAQAARLFGLAPDECARVLDDLVRDGFLVLGSDGLYRLMH
jgi:hypothetical protein